MLAGTSGSGQGQLFLGYALLIGFSSVAVQMLIPLAAHLAPEHQRGRVVGNIMGGLLLASCWRPLSSLVADHFGWRAVFIGAAGVMLAIILLLASTLPQRRPEHKASYAGLMLSLLTLLRRYPPLRQRSLYQALMFAAFSLYWTAVPLALAAGHGLSQSQIALFALVGAVVRLRHPLPAAWRCRACPGGSLLALLLAPAALLLGLTVPGYSVIGLGLTGVLLDFAVQMNMVIGQREVYALDPASRGRLNAVYMTSIFLGGQWVRQWPVRCSARLVGQGALGRRLAGAGAAGLRFPGTPGSIGAATPVAVACLCQGLAAQGQGHANQGEQAPQQRLKPLPALLSQGRTRYASRASRYSTRNSTLAKVAAMTTNCNSSPRCGSMNCGRNAP